MSRKILSIICLALLIGNSIVNVYATTNNNTPNTTPNVDTNNLEFIKINNTVEIDKDINMILYLDNIPYDTFTFKLYSNNSLEEVNTKDIDLKNYNNEEISFDYCINCSNLKTITLNYKLPTNIEIGNQITFSVQLINKDNTEETMNYRGTVTVIESTKKEEEKNQEKEFDEKEKNMNARSNFSGINISNNKTSSSPSTGVSTTYKGSSNNYLSNITIKGYKLNKTFIKERLTYFVTVPNSVKSLSITASKENSYASVNISGNSNFSVGVNKVLITVTAQDGRIKNYRIYVTRLDSDSNEK